jgi:hypothetical protein
MHYNISLGSLITTIEIQHLLWDDNLALLFMLECLPKTNNCIWDSFWGILSNRENLNYVIPQVMEYKSLENNPQ